MTPPSNGPRSSISLSRQQLNWRTMQISVNAIVQGISVRRSFPGKRLRFGRRDSSNSSKRRFAPRLRADRPLTRDGTVDDVAEAALYFAGEPVALRHGHRAPIDAGRLRAKWDRA